MARLQNMLAGRRRPPRHSRALPAPRTAPRWLGVGLSIAAAATFVWLGSREETSARDEAVRYGSGLPTDAASPATTPDAARLPVVARDATRGPSATAIPTDGRTQADIDAGLLSLDVPTSAGGTLVVVPGKMSAPGPGRVVEVRVEVEAGLPVDPEVFASFAMATLNDPRGWGSGGTISFARTDGEAEIRVVLASGAKVDAMCAPLRTRGYASCGRNHHAALNYARWATGTDDFATNVQTYRQYVVNHEVGHLLGHEHEKCPGAGRLAPIMQQQTYRLAPCTPNAWPYP